MNEYIKRDEAIRKAIDACIKVVGHGITQFDAVDIAEAIESIPTADVDDVRHGKWIVTKMEYGWNCAEYPMEFTCSVCGRTEPNEEPFCHCGAKMDGKDGDIDESSDKKNKA